eukprot:symbB.v1.2.009583.t1/scaffold611.1/size181545/6
MEKLASGNQHLPILHKDFADGNASFTYEPSLYSKRKVFVSTEDPKVIEKALKLCGRWKVMYTKAKRSNDDSWMKMSKDADARQEVLNALVNLELALEADGWICTLLSNWCRLIDELRQTVAMKAGRPYLSLSKQSRAATKKGQKPAKNSYLDWRMTLGASWSPPQWVLSVSGWFRLVLFLVLIIEVSLRLLLTFNLGDQVGRDQFVSWICDEYWGGKAHPHSLDNCRMEFARWIDSEANREEGTTPLMLMEFLCLFFLGIIQQLLECVALKRPDEKTMQRKKLTCLYWWPLLVWLCTFTLSLARGTLLGLSFLLLFIGVTFSSSKSLSTRRRWVWRARLFALLFLLIGLAFQSPLLPCSRAMCKDGVHQIYLTLEECVHVEALDLSVVGSEAQTSRCFDTDDVEASRQALGHDTMWTLAVQIIGIRRVQGDNLWDGILALFVSQLGQMVLLIVAATVQLRMYTSPLFSQYSDVFVEEPEEVILARAQRFATEFYCGVKLEELAARHRLKALVEKLHHTKQKIQDLLKVNYVKMGKNSRCAAMLKPASVTQVSEIFKYANDKNFSIVPMLRDKKSGKLEHSKGTWTPVSEDRLMETLKPLG